MSCVRVVRRRQVRSVVHGVQVPSTATPSAESGILNNELYVGRLGVESSSLREESPHRKASVAPQPDIRVDVTGVPDLRIVSDNVWTAAKSRQKKTRHTMKAGAIGAAKRPQYLFSGLTKCGICGAGFIMSAKNRPGCFGARDQGRCDDHLTIRCDASTRNSTRATAALSAAVAENVTRPLTVADAAGAVTETVEL
jgi:hypothetical protein